MSLYSDQFTIEERSSRKGRMERERGTQKGKERKRWRENEGRETRKADGEIEQFIY